MNAVTKTRHGHWSDSGRLHPEIDARDSDHMELPDATNASRGNVPMALASGIVFLFLVLLVVHLVGLHFKA